MSKTLKNLVIALGITVICGGLYLFITMKEQAVSILSDVVANPELVDTNIAFKTEKILSDIQNLNKYRLDANVLTNPRFTSLKDFTVEIPDIKTGRQDPFEPVN